MLGNSLKNLKYLSSFPYFEKLGVGITWCSTTTKFMLLSLFFPAKWSLWKCCIFESANFSFLKKWRIWSMKLHNFLSLAWIWSICISFSKIKAISHSSRSCDLEKMKSWMMSKVDLIHWNGKNIPFQTSWCDVLSRCLGRTHVLHTANPQ